MSRQAIDAMAKTQHDRWSREETANEPDALPLTWEELDEPDREWYRLGMAAALAALLDSLPDEMIEAAGRMLHDWLGDDPKYVQYGDESCDCAENAAVIVRAALSVELP